MNPAKDKRRQLFETFNHNKENINTINMPQWSSRVSDKTHTTSFSSCSDIYKDELFKVQAELYEMRELRDSCKHKVEYHEKMECFYLSELAALREREERSKRRIQILLEELPSQSHRHHTSPSCPNCEEVLCQNSRLRQELALKDKLISALETDINDKSIQRQAITRHCQSFWRTSDQFDSSPSQSFE